MTDTFISHRENVFCVHISVLPVTHWPDPSSHHVQWRILLSSLWCPAIPLHWTTKVTLFSSSWSKTRSWTTCTLSPNVTAFSASYTSRHGSGQTHRALPQYICKSVLARAVKARGERSLIAPLMAVPWLRLLVAGLPPRRPGFDPGPVHVGFVVDKVALGQVLPRVLRFSFVNFIPPVLHYLEK